MTQPDAFAAAMALLSEELHTTEVVMSVAELDATRAERFGTRSELEAERGAHVHLTECCERCGAPMNRNHAGFWQHTEPTNDCENATLAFRESRL